MLKFIALGLVGAVVVAGGIVRLAPADKSVWNDAVPAFQMKDDATFPNGFASQLDPAEHGGERELLVKLDQIIRQTPRTAIFAGSLDQQTITYVTRSRVFGFPDYTTVSIQPVSPSRLVIYGRARFGKSDLGVNKSRVQGWLAQLDGPPPEDTATQ